MAKVLCVLYPDPIDGFPIDYAREYLPTINNYPDGLNLPNPKAIDFTPGQLLGSVSGELGLRAFLENAGHELIVTHDKEGHDSVFEHELKNADIVISQPFWPAYLDEKRFAKAKNLKLVITAGIGSDHIDLNAAKKHDVTVAEITYSNSISVAEHAVMMILALVRNYLPSHHWVLKKGWNIADCAMRSYDLEGMDVGILGAGRIGVAVMKRLKPFDVNLHYHDRHRLSSTIEKELNLTYHNSAKSLGQNCDVLTIHCPLHKETDCLIDNDFLNHMRKGAYIINTARGKICERDAIKHALESGRLAGYAGDVWFPQPAEENHPWRTMPNHGMTPHISGTSLSAQARYAAGTREILECWFTQKSIPENYLIVTDGKLAGVGKHSYS